MSSPSPSSVRPKASSVKDSPQARARPRTTPAIASGVEDARSREPCGVQDSPMVRRSSLSLGILALLFWAVSWSWLVGFGVIVVRVGEIGAVVMGIAAVVVGATTRRRSGNVGLWCGVVALVLVFGLNVLGLLRS